MKKLMTLGLVLVAFLLDAPTVSAQNAHQKKRMEHADEVATQITKKLDLDKTQTAYLKRGLYSYGLRMEQRAKDSENALSKEEIEKQFTNILQNVMSSDELQKVKKLRDELTSKKSNANQLNSDH